MLEVAGTADAGVHVARSWGCCGGWKDWRCGEAAAEGNGEPGSRSMGEVLRLLRLGCL